MSNNKILNTYPLGRCVTVGDVLEFLKGIDPQAVICTKDIDTDRDGDFKGWSYWGVECLEVLPDQLYNDVKGKDQTATVVAFIS